MAVKKLRNKGGFPNDPCAPTPIGPGEGLFAATDGIAAPGLSPSDAHDCRPDDVPGHGVSPGTCDTKRGAGDGDGDGADGDALADGASA